MRLAVRRGVFETNSSSTHSLSVCSKSDWDKWKAGELLAKLDNYFELIRFDTFEDAKEHCFDVISDWFDESGKRWELSQKEKNKLYAENDINFYRGFGYYTYDSYEKAVRSYVDLPEYYFRSEIIDKKDKVIFGYYAI